jgi:L-fuculose-phosphate aldolase
MTDYTSAEIAEAKNSIIDIGKKCWQKGWGASNDGNISCRIGDNALLCTVSGISKNLLTPAHICLVDEKGYLLEGSLYNPSSELKMHLRVYTDRPDVMAVCHAHPPYATAWTITGKPLPRCVLPEIIQTLGAIPTVPYGTPSTNEIPDNLAPFLPNHNAWLLEQHGALTAGTSLYEAYFRMESVELYAQMLSIANGVGEIRPLGKERVAALQKLHSPESNPAIYELCVGCADCDE